MDRCGGIDPIGRREYGKVLVELGRDGRINTYYEAIVNGKPLPADGRWGKATLELLLAIEESGAKRAEMRLSHQVPAMDV